MTDFSLDMDLTQDPDPVPTLSGSDNKSSKYPVTEDDLWFWKTFRLITPYSAGRFVHVDDISHAPMFENFLTLPGISFDRMLDKRLNESGHVPAGISTDTLINIVTSHSGSNPPSQLDRKDKITELKREALEKMVEDIMREERGKQTKEFKKCPVTDLMFGILHSDNYKWLSKKDLELWKKAWGSIMAPFCNDLSDTFQKQNTVLKEVHKIRAAIGIKSAEFVPQFIQEQYDIPTRSP